MQSAGRPLAVPASPLVLDVLDRLTDWTSADALATALDLPLSAIDALLQGLLAHDLIEEEDRDTSSAPSDLGAWAAWSPAAHLFHVATRDVAFGRRVATGPVADVEPRPPAVLPDVGATRVALPQPALGDESLRAVLRTRRTHRRFTDTPIDAAALGTLLGVTFGVQAWAHADEGPLALKTSPSGGARHSLEAYAWVRDVSGVASGLYHYRPDDHVLSALGDGPHDASITRWLPTQTGFERAGVVIVLACVLPRVTWRYRSARAYRVVLIEAGHLGQTFCLAATALGLAPFCTAALADSVIEQDLGLDVRTQPVMYALGVGHAVEGDWQPHEGRPAPRLEVTDLGRSLNEPPLTR